jgi:predicted metal-dependent RNase
MTISGLNLVSLGASQDIGKSAFLLSDSKNERKVLLDCGIQIFSRRSGKKSEGPKEIKEIADGLDAVLLSHAHIDHSGYIPALFHHGFAGKIYTTKPTTDIVKLLWNDHLKIEGKYHYNGEDLQKAIESLKGFNYQTKIKICDGTFAEFFDAGHILGSAMIQVDFDGMVILYSGDIQDQNTGFHNKFKIPDENIDILLTETTNAERPIQNRSSVLNSLLDTIYATYKRGGKTLIPSFALGRSQEIQYYLINHLGEFLSSYPLIVDGMILKMNKIYEKYFNANWVSEEAITTVYDRDYGDSPFDHTNIQQISKETINSNLESYRKKMMISKKRKIILSTSGMVEGGPLYTYLKHQKSLNDTMAFVGYQASDTVGRDILNGIRKFEFTTPWGEGIKFNLQLDIQKFGFSGHSSREGIMELIQKTNPSRTFTIHGSLKAQNEFKNFVKKKNGFSIEQMKPTELIKLA